MEVNRKQFKVQAGEKFACAALPTTALEICDLPPNEPACLGHSCWASSGLPFRLNDRWKLQLGEFEANWLERGKKFVFTTKMPSAEPEILNEQDTRLLERLNLLLWGIAIVAGVPSIEFGSILSGGRTAQDALLRRVAPIESFYRTPGTSIPSTTVSELRSAARFVERFEKIVQRRQREQRSYWRPVSGLYAFVAAMKAPQAEIRLHQFVRAIESFLSPSVFGAKKFCKYACKFLRDAPRAQTTLRQMYDLRSAAEHHRLFDTRTLRGIQTPEKVAMQRARQAEAFARELYRRFFAEQEDYLEYFKDDKSLNTLWSDADKLATVWGEPFDIDGVA